MQKISTQSDNRPQKHRPEAEGYEGAQTLGALKSARDKCDEIYSEIVSVIESCSVLMDHTEPYETFISEWNAEVERIKLQLKRSG